MLAIYKRELKSYFRSFVGMLFIAVTLFFVGLYFFIYNMLQGYPYFAYAVSSVVIFFLISVPVLTMRILAEEKRSKTDQLILTAPVSVGDIVMGKFLALLTIFAIPTAVISTYPLIMNHFGDIPMTEAYIAILGFFLYGMLCIAIGVLISSLTESQVISSVLTFMVLFLFYMMNSICGVISETGNLLTKFLGCFDMSTPFANLLNGTLDVQSVVYFISMSALALFLAVQSIQKRRYSVSVKSFSMGAYSTSMIAVMVAIVAVVNIAIGELPASWVSIDVTTEKLYSITDQTKEYLATVDEEVKIYVIVAEDSQDVTLGQTLQRYDDASDYITVEYVDPNVNPRFHTQYTSSSLTMNSIIVVSDKRSKVIDYSDIYVVEYAYDYTYYSYTSTVTGYDGEGQLTSAIDYVLTDNMPKIYMTEGHGEYTFSTGFTEALAKENVDYEVVNLLNYQEIPEDAACLVINAAVQDFSEVDAQKVIDYLNKGGNVVLIVGYTEEETPNLDMIADYVGITVVDGLIVEQDQGNYYAIPYYLLPNVDSSVYTANVYSNYYIFAPYAQGMLIDNEEAEGMTYKTFLTTSDKAFSKLDNSNMSSFDKSEGDVDGPFALGIAAKKTLEDGSVATVVMYSCEQIFTDESNSMVSGANQMMFINTISQFVDHEVSISIPAKSYEVTYLTIPQSKAVLVGIITAIILPVGCLVTGFVIWYRRRKR